MFGHKIVFFLIICHNRLRLRLFYQKKFNRLRLRLAIDYIIDHFIVIELKQISHLWFMLPIKEWNLEINQYFTFPNLTSNNHRYEDGLFTQMFTLTVTDSMNLLKKPDRSPLCTKVLNCLLEKANRRFIFTNESAYSASMPLRAK